MIKLEHTEVVGWEHAIRGMRNPMNSWDKSDSYEDGYNEGVSVHHSSYFIGNNDLTLMKKLSKAGTDHRKFMRMIVVYVDITAPDYWFKEFSTYRVGVTENSTSTMHKIQSKEFTHDDFSFEHIGKDITTEVFNDCADNIIECLNEARLCFLDDNNKNWWWQMIQLLPMSYNYRRTVCMNYEVLANIYHSRKNHKLDEWHELCRWIESLPYSEIITGGNKNE